MLSDRKYKLKEVSFTVDGGDVQKKDVYFRTNSAAVLPYSIEQQTVLLIRQIRIPTYLNGNESGMLVECCAGMIDEGETPEACMKREAVEEMGYELKELKKVYEAYMSPASVAEMITLFIVPYTPEMKTSEGGGLKDENEEIEVMEMPLDKAFGMMDSGEIRDAKTIILLQYLKLSGIMGK
jgi:GDP-mannose pyrophosphatase NudK